MKIERIGAEKAANGDLIYKHIPTTPILINWLDLKTTDLEVESGWSSSTLTHQDTKLPSS